jgi:hypothetical protein
MDGIRPAPLRVRLRSGETLLIPLVQVHGGALRFKEFCGFPLGGYTCFLRSDGTPASSAECDEAMSALERYADATTLVPWPLGPVPSRTAPAATHETSVVDLSGGIDAALKGVAGIFRRMAGQAERRGVVCEPSNEPDAVDRYYDLLEASARRWGVERPTISKALIAAVMEFGGRDAEIWFAHAEGTRIAGGVVFYGATEFFFWSAAMLSEYGRLRPSNALNFALMRAAAERGMLWYNLGSSEGLPGVARFKHDLGARDIPYGEVRTAGLRYTIYSNVRRALASKSA